MIKGSLLLSAPIVKRFRSKKLLILGHSLTFFMNKYGFNIN